MLLTFHYIVFLPYIRTRLVGGAFVAEEYGDFLPTRAVDIRRYFSQLISLNNPFRTLFRDSIHCNYYI